MDIAFKNLIYDYYSKDLSKKVKSAMGMKQEKAKFVNTVPYGYKADPADKHHLIIDVETAPIVRRIFMEVIGGKSCTQIAKELNTEGIPTPAQHKAVSRKAPSKKPQWTHRGLLTMIESVKYTGTMVNHTRESRFIRDKNQRRVPKEESTISRHIKNIFTEGELKREAVVANFATTAGDGKTYQVDYYNLDVIISVGYRVKSQRGVQFRIWATGILREYMRKGFALDDERLKNLGGGGYFKELLERIRDIRASEKVFYRQVLEI